LLDTRFDLAAPYAPAGDQPAAIATLVDGLQQRFDAQTLLGITGSGKTYAIANVIQQVQRPTLVLAHNKTLAAQLCNELREFFPQNRVEYFISYYDYYQPEAYIPRTDTYIEKSASINDEIDRLRHSATRSLLERRDVIVVASVSCIYGLGQPQEYLNASVTLKVGEEISRDELLLRLIEVQYERNDVELARGRFRVRGDTLEIVPAYEDNVFRIELFGDEIDRISEIDPVTGEILSLRPEFIVWPAKHFVTSPATLERAVLTIEAEAEARVKQLNDQGKLLEAQRLEQRTRYDLEMLREIGYCQGIENYSRHFTGLLPGEPPPTLLDYFSKDFLLIIDESHITIPQIQGMYNGDRARKETLVEHGFRLPSAMDNRPLKIAEFWEKVGQKIFVSATPGSYELDISERKVEMIIRPTGLVDPEVFVRPIQGQIDDLLGEVRDRIDRSERVLVTTLTKRMAEDLTEYMQEVGIRVRYLHSDIKSLERIAILRDLREGAFDVLIGVNLLREGLDLPEVSLVAILDADKEGFLRSDRSLIQMIGRAARHPRGQVLMYADKLTDSMARALDETERRRVIQLAHNERHGIVPQAIKKSTRNLILESLSGESIGAPVPAPVVGDPSDLPALIKDLEHQMKQAASILDFETAAVLRDQLQALREQQEAARTGKDPAEAKPRRRASR
jgi:excinuclease ABC subunit B